MVNNNQLHKNIRCITVSNCKHFCSAYVIENLSSELQQTKLFGIIIINVNMQKSLLKFLVEMQFQANVFLFLQKVAIVLAIGLIVIGSCFQIVGSVTEKACLSILSFVLRSKLLETNDLRVHEISEKCSRLTKHVICWVERQNNFIATPFGVLRF